MTIPIDIGTVLLEANRRTAAKQPGFAVSDGLGRSAATGFAGIELWQNHALLATGHEQEALRSSPVPLAVFNRYVTLDAAGAEGRAQVANLRETWTEVSVSGRKGTA